MAQESSSKGMIPAGFMMKKVCPAPDNLRKSGVTDVYSVSECISEAFTDYVPHWKHNGWWFFDSPSIIDEIAQAGGIDLFGHRLFYYEVYEEEFDGEQRTWRAIEPEPSFPTRVSPPERKILEGYDVVSFSSGTMPECSPLSCNGLCDSIPVSPRCLLGALDEAKLLLEAGLFTNCEPGPYRIFAVYSVE